MSKILAGLVVLIVLLAGLGWLSERDRGPLVINHAGETKLLVRKFNLPFGKSLRVIEKPGLSLRFPGLSRLVTFDARIQHSHLSAILASVKPPESDALKLECSLLWRIQDPELFYESFRTSAEKGSQISEAAAQRLTAELHGDVASEISRHGFGDLLGDRRNLVLSEILHNAQTAATAYGVQVVDVRFVGLEESAEFRDAVYQHMRNYQAQVAADFRAQALQEAEQLRAKADADFRRTVAEVEKQTALMRASADAEAGRVYAEAYEQDREFFRFLRSLEAYRKALDSDTTLVVSPDNGFFEYFESDAKRGK